jgi:c-di-GMP-binding flagellar brake protein YcgR
MQERRQHIRISKFLTISYEVLDQFIKGGSRSKNISGGGLCMPLIQRLKPGTLLKLEIRLVEFSKPIVATGKVIWLSEKREAQFPFIGGVEFVKIDLGDLNRIRRHIAKESQSDIALLE